MIFLHHENLMNWMMIKRKFLRYTSAWSSRRNLQAWRETSLFVAKPNVHSDYDASILSSALPFHLAVDLTTSGSVSTADSCRRRRLYAFLQTMDRLERRRSMALIGGKFGINFVIFMFDSALTLHFKPIINFL